MKDLPVNVLSNIVSYTHGEPEYVKKHSEALKRIHNKYKMSRLGPKMTRHVKSRKKIYKIECFVLREGVSFSLKSIEDNNRRTRSYVGNSSIFYFLFFSFTATRCSRSLFFDLIRPCILTCRIRRGRCGGGVGDQVLLAWDPSMD